MPRLVCHTGVPCDDGLKPILDALSLVIIIICLILSRSRFASHNKKHLSCGFRKNQDCVCVCLFRPVFEGCFSEEPLPYSDPTGAAGGGNCRLDSPSQESRLQAQRIRGQDSRGHGHTPQNRPHGHQPPDLPEGYGQSHSLRDYVTKFSDQKCPTSPMPVFFLT